MTYMFATLPKGTDFFAVGSNAVARLPDGSCVVFDVVDGLPGKCRGYPTPSEGFSESGRLTVNEFDDWLRTGRNKFESA